MKKIFFILLIIFIVLILCIRAAAPILLKGIAERELTEFFNMETRIRQVDVNPLRARVSLIGIEVSHIFGGEEATSIKIEELDIEPGFNISIYGLEVATQRDENGRVNILDTIFKERGSAGDKKIGFFLKKASIKEARFTYAELYNLPSIYEKDRYLYNFTDINIIYDEGVLSMRGCIEDGSMGSFELKGKFVASGKDFKFSGTSQIRDFNIQYAWVSYYNRFPANIGYGRLGMTSQFFIEDGMIDASNSVRITDLRLLPKTQGAYLFGLPPDEVMNHLKDQKGRVDFDFTIKGPLNDPKFSLSEEFQAALQSAIISSVTTKIRKIKEAIDILRGKAPEGQGGLFPFLKSE